MGGGGGGGESVARSLFHKLQFSEDMLKKWNLFIQRPSAPSSLQKYAWSSGSSGHNWIMDSSI